MRNARSNVFAIATVLAMAAITGSDQWMWLMRMSAGSGMAA